MCVKDDSLHIEQEEESASPSDASSFVVGIVRSPFDYYVSLWTYNSCGGGVLSWGSLTQQQRKELLAPIQNCHDPKTPLGTDSEDLLRFRKWLAAVNNEDVGTASMRFFYSYAATSVTTYPLWKSSLQLFDVGRIAKSATIVDNLKHFDHTRICWVRTDNLVSTFRVFGQI